MGKQKEDEAVDNDYSGCPVPDVTIEELREDLAKNGPPMHGAIVWRDEDDHDRDAYTGEKLPRSDA